MAGEISDVPKPRELTRRDFLMSGIGAGVGILWGGAISYRMIRDSRRSNTASALPNHPPVDCEMPPVEPVELPQDMSPERKAAFLEHALNENKKVTGVDVAIDYEVLSPRQEREDSLAPLYIRNPLILGEGIYGGVAYNQNTGEARVFVAPEGGTLQEVPYSPAMEQAGQPEPRPHTVAGAGISRVFTDDFRFYFTARMAPGCISPETTVDHIGEVTFAGM